MTTKVAGLPFWELTFDADGDPDAAQRDELVDETGEQEITDLVVFAHGWNNDRAVATKLYTRFFTLLADQLEHRRDAGSKVGLVGVLWPSRRWADEPVPDFDPPSDGADDARAGDGSASLSAGAPASDDAVMTSELDAGTLADLKELFPDGSDALDRMAELLTGPATPETLEEFRTRLGEFAATGTGEDDGEDGRPERDGAQPGMLLDDADTLFERYREALRAAGVTAATTGGEAGVGDKLRGIWAGAKEALRQATYWQMKNRAGVVGREGLGPVIGRLHEAHPSVRVHLIGHSFGARLVSYALPGLPDVQPSPVKSVTLLQGAFSHFAFAKPLPFDASRNGALAGMLMRIDGPLVVCFSEHDGAVGRFYPLASMAARDDSAAAQKAMWRWGGMGADGAQGVDAKLVAVKGAGPGNAYTFTAHGVLNVDAADVVKRGGAPTGAHSDIVHPELTWVVLSAGGVVG